MKSCRLHHLLSVQSHLCRNKSYKDKSVWLKIKTLSYKPWRESKTTDYCDLCLWRSSPNDKWQTKRAHSMYSYRLLRSKVIDYHYFLSNPFYAWALKCKISNYMFFVAVSFTSYTEVNVALRLHWIYQRPNNTIIQTLITHRWIFHLCTSWQPYTGSWWQR